ncbi:MAG: ParA family protein [Planctomycetota bacterium]
MRIVAVMNQKGGVGKTTTAVNLGALLAAEFGKRVLLVDCDPQGNLSDHLGLDPFAIETSVYDVILRNTPPQQVARPVHGLTVIPANIDLAGAEVELASMTVRETRLRNALRGYCRDFDVTLLDCPPSLGLLTLSALALAGEVLVPMEAEYLAMRGLGQLAHTVELVRDNLNRDLAIRGIVFCQYNRQTRLAQEVRDEVSTHFPDAVYQAVIRRNVRLAEASSHSLPTVLYDPACAGVEDYRMLAAEFLRRGGEDIPLPVEEEEEAPDADADAGDAPRDEPPRNIAYVD